ncbi:MAG: SAM-dependent methyltransferase, partial [Acidimicrobiia bacterium]
WLAWHGPYDDPESFLSRRLAVVEARIRSVLDAAPPGPIRVVSVCAGQGRDLLGALQGHPRAADVDARLVERDPRNTEIARNSITAAGLARVDVVTGDASWTSAYAGAVPADLVLLCGVFGNITDSDIEHTIRALPGLCAAGAAVVWTRHRLAPDLTPTICRWFTESGFEELDFESPGPDRFAVGTHRFATEPIQLPDPPRKLFTFVGYDALLNR